MAMKAAETEVRDGAAHKTFVLSGILEVEVGRLRNPLAKSLPFINKKLGLGVGERGGIQVSVPATTCNSSFRGFYAPFWPL